MVAFGEVGAFEEASSVVGYLEASSEMGSAPGRERIRLEQALVSSGQRRASGSEEAESDILTNIRASAAHSLPL